MAARNTIFSNTLCSNRLMHYIHYRTIIIKLFTLQCFPLSSQTLVSLTLLYREVVSLPMSLKFMFLHAV